MSPRQLATALAALRYYQSKMGVDPIGPLGDIATDGGTLTPLTPREIDALCESLNQPKEQTPTVVVVLEGGMVQATLSDRRIHCAVVDYDVEGRDTDALAKVPQGQGRSADAACFRIAPEVAPERAKELLGLANKVERARSAAGPSR